MAAITTAASGNWSNAATWTGGALPTASDTVVLNHAVTLDQDAAIAGLTNANTSRLTIAAGKTLSSTGNVALAMAYTGTGVVKQLLEMGAGSAIELDPPSGQTVELAVGGAAYGNRNTLWTANGTSEAPCEVRKKVGALGTANATANAVAFSHMNLSRLGSATVKSLYCNMGYIVVVGPGVIWDGGRVDGCGEVNVHGGGGGSPEGLFPFEFRNLRFVGSTAARSVYVSGSATTDPSIVRWVADCAFDAKVEIALMQGMRIERDVFGGGVALSAAAAAGRGKAFADNLVWHTGAEFNIQGVEECADNYVVRDGDGGNPHFVVPVDAPAVTGFVFEAPTAGTIVYNDTGDVIMHPPAGCVLSGNLVLPIESGPRAGQAAGVLCLPNHASGAGLVIERNTVAGKYGVVNLAEAPRPVYAGMIASYRRNLVHNPDAPGTEAWNYKIHQFGGNEYSLIEDAAAAADCDYNAGYHLSAGSRGKGYNFPGAGSPGAHDVDDVDPLFVDATRNVRTWGLHKGLTAGSGMPTGTVAEIAARKNVERAAALALLASDPSLIADLHAWVRAGFVPTNPLLNVDGVGWIGAMDGTSGPEPDPLSIGSLSLSNDLGTSLTATCGAASGGTPPYSYQLQTAPDQSGSPGGWLNLGSPTATPTWNVTGITAGASFWFRAVVTDAASPTPLTATSGAVSREPLSAAAYTLTGPTPLTGEVGRATTFTLTPDGDLAATITPSDGLSGGLAGTFDPTSLAWAGTSEARTFTYTPPFVGVRTITATNDGALTDPAGLAFKAVPQVGAGVVPYPSTAPEYTPGATFHQPDLGGLTFFRDEDGEPVGPFGEYMRPILDDAPAPYSAAIMTSVAFKDYVLSPQGCFGNSSSPAAAPYLRTGYAYNVADAASDPETAFVVDNGVDGGPSVTVSDPGTFPVPAGACVQGVSGVTPTTYASGVGDAHLCVLKREADGSIRWMAETYHSYKDPTEPNVWRVCHVAFTDLATGGGGCRAATPLYRSMTEYANGTPWSNPDAVCADGQNRPMGWTGPEAAGVPILPFCARYDEAALAQTVGPDEPIPHAIRMTFANYDQIQGGGAYSWPATHAALAGGQREYLKQKLIYGQRIKLSKTWWLANREKYPPFARTVLATLAVYGGFVSDGGTRLAPTFVVDSRWPWDDDLKFLQFGGTHGGESLAPIKGENFEAMPPVPYFFLACDPPATTHDLSARTFTPFAFTFQVNPAAIGTRFPASDSIYIGSAGSLEQYIPLGSFKGNTPGVQSRTITWNDPDDLSKAAVVDGRLDLAGVLAYGHREPASFTVTTINAPVASPGREAALSRSFRLICSASRQLSRR